MATEIQPRPSGLTTTNLAGQWIGSITGSNVGTLRIDVDLDRPSVAAVHVLDPVLPFTATGLASSPAPGKYEVRLSDFRSASEPQPGTQILSDGSATLMVANRKMHGKWTTNIGTKGDLDANLIDAPPFVRPADEVMTWKRFYQWVADRDHAETLFRGQSDSSLPLTTSFHRRGRRNIRRYVAEDLPQLRRALEPQVNSIFPPQDPEQTGCLLALAQHHGYPTPLLDWTRSPFIAAYFAFRDLLQSADSPPRSEHVRIFVFSRRGWRWGSPTGVQWEEPAPRIAPLELAARFNPRSVPQQSILLFSNLVDIEQFVAWSEDQDHQRYLQRFDIPASECRTAMRQLALMGITAGSMFPGIDGACRSLAEQYF